MSLRDSFSRAIDNVSEFGDTDIFPFPFENRILTDSREQTCDLLEELHKNFFDKERPSLSTHAPINVSALAPVSYGSYRWATQVDPLWNLYLLGLVIDSFDEIEAARIGVANECVFSYRKSLAKGAGLFRDDLGWHGFLDRSLELAKDAQFVVTCDISEFYPRVSHHRLENALAQARPKTDALPRRINDILITFSGSRSVGLPVGGPAARILAELSLNAVDRLLVTRGIRFCRFVDDYHIFCKSLEDAHRAILFLAEKLQSNEGLSLQKSKTRISHVGEFVSSTLHLVHDRGTDRLSESQEFLRVRLKYDPYSEDPLGDYDKLQDAVRKHDILGMLERELEKSRVHTPLVRKLLSAIPFMGQEVRPHIARTLATNLNVLAPVFPRVMLTLRWLVDEMATVDSQDVHSTLRTLVRSKSYLATGSVNLQYLVRVLARENSPENESLLAELFQTDTSPLVQRDIHATMVSWRHHPWVSDRLRSFNTMNSWERRTAIVGSFILGDEGSHWRKNNSNSFSPFEKVVRDWVAMHGIDKVAGRLV